MFRPIYSYRNLFRMYKQEYEVEHKLPINQGMGIRTRSFESFSVEKCQVTNQCLE